MSYWLAVVRHVISFATLVDKPLTPRLYISGDCSSRILDDKICVKMAGYQKPSHSFNSGDMGGFCLGVCFG